MLSYVIYPSVPVPLLLFLITYQHSVLFFFLFSFLFLVLRGAFSWVDVIIPILPSLSLFSYFSLPFGNCQRSVLLFFISFYFIFLFFFILFFFFSFSFFSFEGRVYVIIPILPSHISFYPISQFSLFFCKGIPLVNFFFLVYHRILTHYSSPHTLL